MRRIGVMGGTFDPVHHGHLVAASEVAHDFTLDEVIFVPTGEPYQKDHRQVSPAEDRYLMTVIATASNPKFSVSRVDIDRGGPTYTIDTLRDLRGAAAPEDEFFFITGADALAEIDLARRGRAIHPGAFCRLYPTRTPAVGGGPAGREGQPGGDPGAVDLLDRVPRPGRRGPAGLVPGPRRGGAVHRQARPVRQGG